VQWPIFNAGRIRANIEVQNAREEQALILYEQTVLAALQEVENALTAHYNEQATRNSLIKAVEANSRAFEISNELYARGLVDFLTVLESQRSLYLSEDQLAQSEARVSANLVALFKALGGGWEVTP
jgi:outer membrane protein TolC